MEENKIYIKFRTREGCMCDFCGKENGPTVNPRNYNLLNYDNEYLNIDICKKCIIYLYYNCTNDSSNKTTKGLPIWLS